jgi:hypothetical protein
LEKQPVFRSSNKKEFLYKVLNLAHIEKIIRSASFFNPWKPGLFGLWLPFGSVTLSAQPASSSHPPLLLSSGSAD